MDYSVLEDDMATTGPMSYDVAAIKYLYGLSDDLPTDPFCTDENTVTDPTCNTYDHGADPLADDFLPTYSGVVDEYLTKVSDTPPNTSLNHVLAFVRAGSTPAVRLDAFNKATARVSPLSTHASGDDPSRIDGLATAVLARLLLDSASARGGFSMDPPGDPALVAAVTAHARGILMNADAIRSWASRRKMVDLLKKQQTAEALVVLHDAQDQLRVARASMTGAEAAQADDLLSRIQQAVSPYFD
jgi:hypothetical protein